jgi:phospholipase/carboxylesterase
MTMRRGRVLAGPGADEGRLRARPAELVEVQPIEPGAHRLGLGGGRDAILFVPSDLHPERPAPFVLSLHGAGGDARSGLYPLHDFANEAGLVLLAPASRGQTWDLLGGGYGPDVARIDEALAWVFARVGVDPKRLAIGGFSDGASYALSLGITNGDLFRSILAFSPGFAAPADQRGVPRIFISHGTGDRVLPIERTSRELAPRLERAGYDVTYREFEGSHTVPAPVAREALAWYLESAPGLETGS